MARMVAPIHIHNSAFLTRRFNHSKYMLTRTAKFMIGCILLILFVPGALYFHKYMSERTQRQKFSLKLAAEVERKRAADNIVEIRLKDLTDFTWDRVHIFTSYIETETIDENLGYAWQPARTINIYQRDDISLLVFINTGKVVFYVDHPRHLGDFDGNYKKGDYSPDEAIFRVVEGAKQDNGLSWLHLMWKWRKNPI